MAQRVYTLEELKEAILLAEDDGRALDLRGAVLDGLDMSGLCLRKANLSGASMRGANLAGAVLNAADLRNAEMNSANFKGAKMQGATLSGCVAMGANFSDAYLGSARMFNSFLCNSDFTGATLAFSSLVGCDMRGANLENVSSIDGACLTLATFNHEWVVRQWVGAGSAGRTTTLIGTPSWHKVHCGCFVGTVAEFEAAIQQTHGHQFGCREHLVDYFEIVSSIRRLLARVGNPQV